MGYLRNSALLCATIFFIAASQAQNLRDTIFADADGILTAAQQKKAFVLSPDSFSKGYRLYKQAEDSLKKGRNLASIRRDLDKAVVYLEKSMDGIKIAEVTFAKTLKAREDAQKANAKKYSAELWQEAERLFIDAAMELEGGDVKDAKRGGAKAEDVYRKAELDAIKGNYLNETKETLARAEKSKVYRYAPKTLEKAKSLLAQAEQALTQNRYDIDQPRDLARQAKYEAGHAIYLSTRVIAVKDKQISVEDLILEHEQAIISIAGAADIVAELDAGFEKPANEIVDYINNLQSKTNQQTVDIEDLEKQLGMLSSERVSLKKREELQKQAERIERMFTRDEAYVLRRGNDMILRLVGINFNVGRSEIEAHNFALIAKVQKAIAVFPEAKLVVEGHTDAFGSDASNLALSQKRAESVKQYLIANMNVAASNISAVGYGESSPVANNETPEGRKKNRRIDIVIKPRP
ncbi:MAG: OmpA family protein [Gammaproteobacteria bacterium]|nr:OmpA family protein [Gammaproteobacteria bacterium]